MAIPVEVGWLVAGVSSVAAGGGLWAYLGERAKLRKSSPAAQTGANADLVRASGDFVKALGDSQQKHADELRVEIRELAAKVAKCEGKHDKCEADLDAERQARQALARRIDELMTRPIAGYAQRPLPGMEGRE